MRWHDCWTGFGGFMPFFFLLFGVLVLWLIFGRHGNRSGRFPGAGTPPDDESPLDIAKRRYASGEITKEEYEEIKKTIG